MAMYRFNIMFSFLIQNLTGPNKPGSFFADYEPREYSLQEKIMESRYPRQQRGSQ